MTRYPEALRWLYGLESRGIKLGLDRIAEAAEIRGHPERALRYVHVAGTNGKGSVSAMVESVLRAAGYRTGQFASPHLQRYVERVRIDGRPISEREAANRIEELRADTRLPPLSFFEYTTLLAFEAFRDACCDIVVLEVGLGGRLDSTNIVTPEASVITNISLEHQRILGDTLAKIAREKAGVLKPGVPCIVGARGTSVRRAISARASAVHSPLRWIDHDFESEWHDRSLSVRVGDRQWTGLRLGSAEIIKVTTRPARLRPWSSSANADSMCPMSTSAPASNARSGPAGSSGTAGTRVSIRRRAQRHRL